MKEFKAPGGAAYLTQKPHALLRHNITTGEIKNMLDTGLYLSNNEAHAVDSDDTSEDEHDDVGPNKKHHSGGKASQSLFVSQVQNFKNGVLELGNMFANTSPELLVVETAEVMPSSVACFYANMEQMGINQYNSFKLDRIHHGKTAIDDPIKRNKVPLFSNVPTTVIPKDKMTIVNLKQDV